MRTFKFNDGKILNIRDKTLIMGILNITPDSFSDGGKFINPDSARRQVQKMLKAGADIIDIGAESTRPGFKPITVDEEIARLEPILKSIAAECPIPISIDTYKSQTAAAALELGANIINDIHGLQADNNAMAKVAAKYNALVIAMHNEPIIGDVIEGIKTYFRRTLKIAEAAGLSKYNIIIDSGIGFNKTQEQNLEILKRLEELNEIDDVKYPQLLGVSRKSIIGYLSELPVDQRDEATGAICIIAITKGVKIIRVHNVEMIAKMCCVADKIIK